MRGGLVEDDHAGPGQQQAGDGQALPFAAGESVAALADHRVQAVGQRGEQFAQPRAVQGVDQLGIARVRGGVAQVGRDGVVEEVPVLRDDADGAAYGRERQVAHVDARQLDGARVDVVEPRDERGDRRLARPGGPDEREQAPGTDVEVDAVQHLLAATLVEHGDVFEGGQRHLLGGGR